MKMTMHIDAGVLDQVMDLTGATSKTKAVEIALTDLARRHRLRKALRAGLGLTLAQWEVEAAAAQAQLADKPSVDLAKVDDFLRSLEVRQRFQSAVAEDGSSTSTGSGGA